VSVVFKADRERRRAMAHRPSATGSRPAAADRDPLFRLQRQAGNLAVQELLALRSPVGRESSPPWGVPAALVVGAADSPLERAADQAADQVLRTRSPTAPPGGEPGATNRFAAGRGTATPAPEIVRQVLGGGGHPIEPRTREFFESRFGRDLSAVRVHSDQRAAASARSIDALAYTVGSHIVLGSGRHTPETDGGRRLLAHELAHVALGHGTAAPDLALRQTATDQRSRATSMQAYVALVREAERRLIAVGHTSADDRIRMLSGLYYGTPWSKDRDVMGSDVRDRGFQIYTARAGPGDDPRPILGRSLFQALKDSQDVAGVDMGHAIIGINARASATSRSIPIPGHGATGLELVTWVGDLGGATARLAADRVRTPRARPDRYFQGTDYGARSNLEGDIAAYLVATSGTGPTVTQPVLPASGLVADALADYFLHPGAQTNRCWQFLIMQGAQFSGRALVNRASVETGMASKFVSFGRIYLANYMRQQGTFTPEGFIAAEAQLGDAARDVAVHFVDWLLACLPATMPATPEPGPLERILRAVGL
jgi:Domain of unknown function (DUF4157)